MERAELAYSSPSFPELPKPSEICPTFNGERYIWLKRQLPIRLLDLDDEVSRIAILVQDIGENAAVADELLEKAKVQMKVAYATAADRLRKTPLEGGKFRSEAMIASELDIQAEVAQAAKDLSECRFDSDLWARLVESIRTKSASLRSGAELIVSQYVTRDSLLLKARREIRDVKV
jgi:hypothetical protein